MEDLTLALITLTSFVLLFVVAIFADRAGADAEDGVGRDPRAVSVDDAAPAAASASASVAAPQRRRLDADVA